MSVIENFNELTEQEVQNFAAELVQKINSERIFVSDTDFKVSEVEADEMTGNLYISVEHADPIEVSREASWTCSSVDDVNNDPGYDADYTNSIFDDAKKAFNTLSATIDGYAVTLDIVDVDATSTVEVEVDGYSEEDAGIGDYEFWGQRGHDSRPYVEVEGTIVSSCECSLSLYVEPIK